MRKHFIDNIRWLCILTLIPYHTFMIYNAFGEAFYIEGQRIFGTSAFIATLSPWFMPLLFVLAGMSSYYALQRRTPSAYAKERVFKLLIPLFAGIILVVPAQTYIAERFHNGFTGSYFYQYILFFTAPTDLSGTRGGFTPAHLWFLLYLFVISMVALPLMNAYKNAKRKLPADKMPLLLLLSLFIMPFAMMPILDIGGHSLGGYFAYFILGYLVLSADRLLEKLDRLRRPLLLAAAICVIGNLFLLYFYLHGRLAAPIFYFEIFRVFYGWLAILTILGLGRHHLNFRNKTTDYLSASAFPVYIFHQSWIVVLAYFIFAHTGNALAQICLIILTSTLFTYATYEICKRIPGLRVLFGIKSAVGE